MSRRDPEKAVEYKEAAVTNTTNKTKGDEKDLSCTVPNTSHPLKEQKEPIVNQGLNGSNTTSDTVVADAETVRGPAVLEGSEFPCPHEVGSTCGEGQETTSGELSDRERNASESASKATMASTEPQQKALETQVLLGSSSKSKDSKADTRVSNITCIRGKRPSCNFCLFRFFCVNRVKAMQVGALSFHIHRMLEVRSFLI